MFDEITKYILGEITSILIWVIYSLSIFSFFFFSPTLFLLELFVCDARFLSIMNPGRLFCGLRLYLSKCDLNAGGARCKEGKAIFKDWKGSRFCVSYSIFSLLFLEFTV
jgi:hypothetical protein